MSKMENELNLGISNLKIYQLGYVYKDIAKQAKIMESVYGTSNFVVFDPVNILVNYRGKEKEINVASAFGKIFDTEIELIQPVEGDSIYNEFLNQGREGFHHICYRINDLETIINEYKNNGVEILQSGKIVTIQYAYLDTEKDLGIILEYTEEKKRGKRKKKKD